MEPSWTENGFRKSNMKALSSFLLKKESPKYSLPPVPPVSSCSLFSLGEKREGELREVFDLMRGAMLGAGCGDALGANTEFLSREEVLQMYGRVTHFLHSTKRPYGCFTDDTEMLYAFGVSLSLSSLSPNPSHILFSLSRFANGGSFKREKERMGGRERGRKRKERGYGDGMKAIIRAALDCDYVPEKREVKAEEKEKRNEIENKNVKEHKRKREKIRGEESGKSYFGEEGSWGNGCLIRIAPLALILSFRHSRQERGEKREKRKDEEELEGSVKKAKERKREELEKEIRKGLLCTHTHVESTWSSIIWSSLLSSLFQEGIRRKGEREGRREEGKDREEREKERSCRQIVLREVESWLREAEERKTKEKEEEGKMERENEERIERGNREIPEYIVKQLRTLLSLEREREEKEKEKKEEEREEEREEEKEEEKELSILDSELDQIIQKNMFGKHFAIRASDALCLSLLSLLRFGENPSYCLCEVASMGGDSDTIGCIVGAALGALHGTSWISSSWLQNLEDGEEGDGNEGGDDEWDDDWDDEWDEEEGGEKEKEMEGEKGEEGEGEGKEEREKREKRENEENKWEPVGRSSLVYLADTLSRLLIEEEAKELSQEKERKKNSES